MNSEPEIISRHERCPKCERNTLDRYDDGVTICDGPGCQYGTGIEPIEERPIDLTSGGGFIVTPADVRDEIIPRPEEGLKMRGMETVKAKPIVWLWRGRIPRGMLTLVVGDPGLGKSQMTLDFAARVSRGNEWPDGSPGDEPRTVFLLSAEDPAAEVLRPRLEAAGADLSRIKQIEAVVTKEKAERFLSLETDLAYLEAALRRHSPSLVLIDPLNAYLGKSETFKDNHVRAILGPLAALAEKYGVAVVAVMHMNKDSSKQALYRAMGSVAFPAAARSSLMVSADPEQHRVLLTAGKANLSKKALGMAFTVETVDLPGGIETSRVVWQADEIEITADEATNLSQPQKRERPREAAVVWLESVLSNGPMASRQLADLATKEGISAATLRRARAELGIVPAMSPETGTWSCALPPADPGF